MRRFVFAPRWVVGHFVMVLAVLSCLLLARWQWDVSRHTHSLQNLAYALQWPLFAVFFAVGWYRMLRLESEKLDEQSGEYEPDPGNDRAAEADEADAEQPVADRRGRPERVVKPPAKAPLLTPPPAPRAAVEQIEPDGEDGEDDTAELAAYNRMLAELAVRDQAALSTRNR